MLTSSVSHHLHLQQISLKVSLQCFKAARPKHASYPLTRPALKPQANQAHTGSASLSAHENESDQDALQRRMRESAQVEERVIQIYSEKEFHQQLEQAGDNLVVLEVESSEVCQTGFDEPEYHWKEDKEATMLPCQKLKHGLQRTARDSPDVRFVTLEASTEEGQAACESLKIEVLPTIQFWKNKQLLWEHRGVTELDQNMSEGVLYYGDQAAHGLKASDHVQDLHSKEQLDSFINGQPSNVLTVVDVSLQNSKACVRVFPAVLALAKNFKGFAHFARVIADESEELQQVLQEHKVVEVPTFLFFRNGKSVGRHVGSSRADLIGQILLQQRQAGIAPPKTGQGQVQPKRQKIVRRV